MVNLIIIVVLGVIIVLIIDAGQRLIRTILLARAPCQLVRALVLPDVCAGTCGPGQICGPIATRNYFFGLFGTQPAACGCIAAPGLGGGLGAGGGTGESEDQ